MSRGASSWERCSYVGENDASDRPAMTGRSMRRGVQYLSDCKRSFNYQSTAFLSYNRRQLLRIRL